MKSKTLTKMMQKAGIIRIDFHDDIMDAYICTVNPKLLEADVTYQRDHDHRHSDSLKNRQVPVWPYPICSFRNGSLYITEGQHRVQKEIKLGHASIRVLVKFGLTISQEAGLYVELNTMKRPNAWNQFRARLLSGDGDFIMVRTLAHKHGLTLRSDDDFNGDIRHTDVIKEALAANLVEPLFVLLTAFKTGDGDLHKRVKKGSIEFQRGLIDFLRKYGADYANDNTIVTLKRLGHSLIFQQADDLCECSRTNRSHYLRALEGLISIRGALRKVA